jgi:hypothetical protein
VDADGEAAERPFGEGHEGQRLAAQVHAAELLEHVAGAGAGDGDLGVLLGHVGGVDLPAVPLGLEPVLHMGVDAVGAARGGVAEPGVVGEAITTPSSVRKPFSVHIRP